MLIINLFLMFKPKLNKLNVKYAYQMKNNNLLKLFVIITYVQNVIWNYYKVKNIDNAQYVEKLIG